MFRFKSIIQSQLTSKKYLFNPLLHNVTPKRNILSMKERMHRTTAEQKQGITDSLLYATSVIVVFIGFTYASVPLYRMFCAATGIGGTPVTHKEKFEPENMKPVRDSKKLKIRFTSSMSDSLNWEFTPQQREITVVPGESALAFYTAKNLADEDIIGVSTYNVVPQQAGIYFNKIQCFCFEEQKLQAGEEVDMPIFFFIDPDFLDDIILKNVDTISLSYTFFKAR
ncbi:hypothetical protein K502DRAFT_309996 [Neoconidiobolus thromboides FSU 785]|nr:hypothetical protein K502DRAFT_309996 [Neoconidiobolus thromboides FSU 785]